MSIFAETLAIDIILRHWKDDPSLLKRDYPWISWWREDVPENNRPPNLDEIQRYLDRLKELNPTIGLLKEQEVLAGFGKNERNPQ